jgi:hypothetical protein
MPDVTNPDDELTPVDDVRRVRERLSREAGGDVRKLAELGMQAFEEYRERLNLRLVSPPSDDRRRTGTQD